MTSRTGCCRWLLPATRRERERSTGMVQATSGCILGTAIERRELEPGIGDGVFLQCGRAEAGDVQDPVECSTARLWQSQHELWATGDAGVVRLTSGGAERKSGGAGPAGIEREVLSVWGGSHRGPRQR